MNQRPWYFTLKVLGKLAVLEATRTILPAGVRNATDASCSCSVVPIRTRARRHKLREVRDRVVGHVPGGMAAVEGDGALAAGAASIAGMGAVVRVCGEIPEQDVAAPVSGCGDQHVADCGGNGKGFVRSTGDGLLGHIKIFVGIGRMHLGHCGGRAAIQMKGRSIDVLTGRRDLQGSTAHRIEHRDCGRTTGSWW